MPYLPRFIREEEKVSGTARGSAYHKALELFPFAEYAGRLGRKAAGGAPDPAEVKAILDRMAEEGTLLKEFREAINPGKIAQFLESSLAARMGAGGGPRKTVQGTALCPGPACQNAG